MDDIQNILTYVIVGFVIVYLIYKNFFKKKDNDSNCGHNCGCK